MQASAWLRQYGLHRVVTFHDVLAAASRIRPYVHRTPVLTSATFDAWYGGSLFFKCENLQKVGAFKARGACSAVMGLDTASLRQGVATHSSGNHAAALAYAAHLRNIPCYVVMPSTAPALKRQAVIGYGATVVDCGPTLADRLEALGTLVAQTGAHVVPPFDDDMVIAGQGTAVLELIEEVGDLDVVIAPVGGGGLISGTSVVVRALLPQATIVAAEPELAGDAKQAVASGTVQAPFPPLSIADGLRTSLSERTLAHLIQNRVDVRLVSETMIAGAMMHILERMNVVVEPSSAVVLAALMEYPELARGKRVGLVLTGGNVDLKAFLAATAGTSHGHSA